MLVNYFMTTLQKQGTLVVGNVTHNVVVTVNNGELTRLNSYVTKKVMKQYPDANGGVVEQPEETYVGSITLENGRRVFEFVQDEDPTPYINTFKEISNEALGFEKESRQAVTKK